MKKFTLYPNDKELNFRVNQYWDYSTPVTLIKNSYCYKYFPSLFNMRKIHAKNLGVNWAKNFIVLELYKKRNKIAYDIEAVQLDFKGKGNKIKITSIDVTVNEKTNKANVKINAQQTLSLLEKIAQRISPTIDNLTDEAGAIWDKMEYKIRKKRLDKKEAKKAFVENIIEKKTKETIT